MKQELMSMGRRSLMLMVALLLSSTTFAQEPMPIDGEEWYTQPWIWLLSAAVFILLFTVILNNDKTDA